MCLISVPYCLLDKSQQCSLSSNIAAAYIQPPRLATTQHAHSSFPGIRECTQSVSKIAQALDDNIYDVMFMHDSQSSHALP